MSGWFYPRKPVRTLRCPPRFHGLLRTTIRTVQDLIVYDRAHPGELSAGSAGTGSSNHFALELFNAKAGTRLTHVPYRGSSAAIADLLGGRLAIIFDQLTAAIPLQREGQARILAVTTKTRSLLLPEALTLSEAGLENYEMYTYLGLVAPAGMPNDVVQRLTAELSAVLETPEFKAKIDEMGSEVADAALRTPAGSRRIPDRRSAASGETGRQCRASARIDYAGRAPELARLAD